MRDNSHWHPVLKGLTDWAATQRCHSPHRISKSVNAKCVVAGVFAKIENKTVGSSYTKRANSLVIKKIPFHCYKYGDHSSSLLWMIFTFYKKTRATDTWMMSCKASSNFAFKVWLPKWGASSCTSSSGMFNDIEGCFQNFLGQQEQILQEAPKMKFWLHSNLHISLRLLHLIFKEQ